MRLIAVAVSLIVLVSACSTVSDPATLSGSWQLVSLTTDGVHEVVVEDVNTASMPWIQLTPGVTGVAGCNGFWVWADPEFVYDSGELVFTEIITNASLCGRADDLTGDSSLMSVEKRFVGALSDPNGVRVSAYDDGRMVWWWEDGRTEFVFTSMPER